MRDFSQDITLMIAGSGKTNLAHLQEILEDWIFGDGDGREVTIVLSLTDEIGPGIRTVAKWIGMSGANLIVTKRENQEMFRDLTSLEGDFLSYSDERMALEAAFNILENRKNKGEETAFVMLYNPESKYKVGSTALTDAEILSTAKGFDWLTTLNLEGMTDYFEGYETEEEKTKREEAVRAFELAEAEKEAANPEPKPAAKKAVAKKATAPRKRAAKKPVEPEPTPLMEEAEKPLEDVSEDKSEVISNLDKFIAERVALDEERSKTTRALAGKNAIEVGEKRDAEFALSATVVLSDDGLIDQDHRNPGLTTVTPEDVWADVAKARSAAVESRQDALLMELGENIAAMGDAFSKTIRTYAALIEERNG